MWTGQTHHMSWGIPLVLQWCVWPVLQSPWCCLCGGRVNSTQDFVEQVKHITVAPGECLSSYDVSALFTSVPIDPALKIIKDLLVKDSTLKDRTVMGIDDIILLLECCLKNTYFSFQGQFFEQVEGAAMGSPVSPIVANLYMEYLEQKALSTAPHPPRFWCRFVDDTFVIHKEANKQGFLQHINSVDPAINLQWKTTRRMVPSPSWTPL